MTNKDQKEINNKQERKRRSLGCAFWAALMAVCSTSASYLILNIVHDWVTGRGVIIAGDFFGILVGWVLISIVILSPLGAFIGWITKEPLNKRKVFSVSVIVITILFFGVSRFFNALCELGDSGIPCISITEAPLTLSLILIAGILIGLLGGYGYWQAGRRS